MKVAYYDDGKAIVEIRPCKEYELREIPIREVEIDLNMLARYQVFHCTQKGTFARKGDRVKIIKGRRDIGKVFTIVNINFEDFNGHQVMYLRDNWGTSIDARNCIRVYRV